MHDTDDIACGATYCAVPLHVRVGSDGRFPGGKILKFVKISHQGIPSSMFQKQSFVASFAFYKVQTDDNKSRS